MNDTIEQIRRAIEAGKAGDRELHDGIAMCLDLPALLVMVETLTEANRRLLESERRLNDDLDHMRRQAGPDSCADYAARNRELVAENERLRLAAESAKPAV